MPELRNYELQEVEEMFPAIEQLVEEDFQQPVNRATASLILYAGIFYRMAGILLISGFDEENSSKNHKARVCLAFSKSIYKRVSRAAPFEEIKDMLVQCQNVAEIYSKILQNADQDVEYSSLYDGWALLWFGLKHLYEGDKEVKEEKEKLQEILEAAEDLFSERAVRSLFSERSQLDE